MTRTRSVPARARYSDVPQGGVPYLLSLPTLSVATPVVGTAVSYTPGTVTGTPTPTRTQQWLIDGLPVGGATASTYTPTSGDIGHQLAVRQTETNTWGTAVGSSAWASVVAAGSGAAWPGTVRTVPSATWASIVSTVTDAAVSDGDVIVIPNGTYSGTSGITISKQILIRAATINPTAGGRSTQSVVITNNSGSPLFNFTTGNTYHCGIAGIRFNEGSQITNYVRMNGSGSKPGIMYDCYIENSDRHGSSTDVACVSWLALGGLLWRNRWIGLAAGGEDGVGPDSGSMVIKSPRAWTTASTLGALDTNGNVNVYLEENYCLNAALFDIDVCGRFVFRYGTFDGSFAETHGFTSGLYQGGRHWEFYNNTIQMSSANRNMPRYFWIRAGHGVFTNNVVNSAATPGQYGDLFISIGDNTSPGSYPMAMQPGYGHNGTTDVSDPIYIWNNTGARAYNYGFQNGWDSIVGVNRDIFVNAIAQSPPDGRKPGYSKYTYPHPFVAGLPTS